MVIMCSSMPILGFLNANFGIPKYQIWDSSMPTLYIHIHIRHPLMYFACILYLKNDHNARRILRLFGFARRRLFASAAASKDTT